MNSIKDKISNKVGKIRSSKKNDTDSAIDIVGKLPKWLRNLVVKVFIFLDNHDMVPESITSNLIYYSTVILSNLGSIHCNAIYHNLTDFGTNSILLTIGEITKENYLDDDGKIVYTSYERHFSKIIEKTLEVLTKIKDVVSKDKYVSLAIMIKE